MTAKTPNRTKAERLLDEAAEALAVGVDEAVSVVVRAVLEEILKRPVALLTSAVVVVLVVEFIGVEVVVTVFAVEVPPGVVERV